MESNTLPDYDPSQDFVAPLVEHDAKCLRPYFNFDWKKIRASRSVDAKECGGRDANSKYRMEAPRRIQPGLIRKMQLMQLKNHNLTRLGQLYSQTNISLKKLNDARVGNAGAVNMDPIRLDRTVVESSHDLRSVEFPPPSSWGTLTEITGRNPLTYSVIYNHVADPMVSISIEYVSRLVAS